VAEEELGKYFHFDEWDLAANRNGALSPKQNERLSQDEKSIRRKFRIAGLVFAACAVLPTLILWLIDRLQSVGWYSLIWIIPGTVLGVILMRAGRRLVTFTLKTAQGPIKITQGGQDHDPDCYVLHVGGTQFGIGPQLAKLLEEGGSYAVYYYWGTDTVESDLMDSYIMAAERMV
jgi:hypothetical protein